MNTKLQILQSVWKQVGKMDNKRMSKQAFPDNVQEFNNLPYIDDGNSMHLLDVYRTGAVEQKQPIIIDIHGGGWMYGTKELNKNYCMHLSTLGFVVFNINYRLVPETTIDGQLRDVFSVLKWIGENCSRYGGDKSNIFLTGDSAGGNLSLLTALLNESEDEKKLFALEDTGVKFNAIGLTSPAVDLISSAAMGLIYPSVLLGDDYRNSPYYKYMNFELVYKDHILPPIYLVTSAGDFVRNHSRKLHKLITDNKSEHFYHDWCGDECSRSLPHVFSVLEPAWDESRITMYEMISYFRRFIK